MIEAFRIRGDKYSFVDTCASRRVWLDFFWTLSRLFGNCEDIWASGTLVISSTVHKKVWYYDGYT